MHTYELEELLGTKLRALYQRKKGRDLYDLWAIFQEHDPSVEKILAAFQHYLSLQGVCINRDEFEKNIALKISDSAFRDDIVPLLKDGIQYDARSAANWFRSVFCTRMN